jgi:hypothetical protein
MALTIKVKNESFHVLSGIISSVARLNTIAPLKQAFNFKFDKFAKMIFTCYITKK